MYILTLDMIKQLPLVAERVTELAIENQKLKQENAEMREMLAACCDTLDKVNESIGLPDGTTLDETVAGLLNFTKTGQGSIDMLQAQNASLRSQTEMLLKVRNSLLDQLDEKKNELKNQADELLIKRTSITALQQEKEDVVFSLNQLRLAFQTARQEINHLQHEMMRAEQARGGFLLGLLQKFRLSPSPSFELDQSRILEKIAELEKPVSVDVSKNVALASR